MKNICSVFLLIVMLANVSVSIVEQIHKGANWYEVKSCNNDADENNKVEKEKEIYNIKTNAFIRFNFFKLADLKNSIFFKNDNLLSERHTFLPELPPEA